MLLLPVTQVSSHNLAELSLRELLNLQITSATLQDESILSVPSSMTVYSKDQWQRMGISRLEDLMNFVPGYQSFRGGGAANQMQYSSRGRRNGYANREILILIDGMRINEDFAGGSFYYTLLSLENVDRVEFLRGPSSAIYGANAFLGVVNIITGTERKLVAEVGTDNDNKLFAQWKTNSTAYEMGMSIERLERGGQTLEVYNPAQNIAQFETSNDGFKHDALAFKLKVGDFSARILHASDSEKGFYTVGRILRDKLLETRKSHVQLKYNLFHNGSVDADIYTEFVNRQQSDNSTEGDDADVFSSVNFKEREFIVGSTLNYTHSDSARGVFGFEWRRPNHLAASQTFSGSVNQYIVIAEQGKREISGVFAQWQQNLGSRWQATTGIRYNHYTDFGTNISPRLAFTYKANTNNRIKLLYGEAFRAPTWNELYAEYETILVGNPDLKPETADTTELIWSHVRDKQLLQLGVFFVDIGGSMRRDLETLMFENTGTETMSGVELEFRRQLSNRWQVVGTATWITNESTKINSEANVFGSLNLNYGFNHFNASLQIHHHGERQNNSAAYIPGQEENRLAPRSTLSTHLQYEFKDNIELYLSAKNLLNSEGYSPADNPANPIGIPNRGREAKIGLRWHF